MTITSYLVPVTSPPRASLIGLQVALGVSAHAAAAGCLPALSTLLVTVPALVLALLGLSHLRAVPRPVLLVAGQGIVHTAMSAAAACVGGSAAHAGADLPGWLSQLMAPAHVLALLLSVAAAAHVEHATTFARRLAVQLLGGLRSALSLLTRTGACTVSLPRVVARGLVARLRSAAALAHAAPRAPPAAARRLVLQS